jgi:hypothetical protein
VNHLLAFRQVLEKAKKVRDCNGRQLQNALSAADGREGSGTALLAAAFASMSCRARMRSRYQVRPAIEVES